MTVKYATTKAFTKNAYKANNDIEDVKLHYKTWEEGTRKANYNLNPYPIGSMEYISFNQGVASVLDLSND